MDNTDSVRWVRRLFAAMQANHARDSREWTRRIEAPPKPNPPGPPFLAAAASTRWSGLGDTHRMDLL
jgi:hypothetical protein